jgi:hypothetical protein
VLRRIFGYKGHDVRGGWRKLHNEDLHNLYSSPSIIRIIKSRIGWEEHLARMTEKRNAYRLLVRNPEGKRPLGKPIRSWVDNIKIDLRLDGVVWTEFRIHQDRDHWWALVDVVMSFRVPWNAGKF